MSNILNKTIEKTTYINKYDSDKTAIELFKQPSLKLAFIKINDVCNAKCSFCDVWKKQTDHHKDIDWIKVTEGLIDLGVREINFHGGEAFLSKEFFNILEFIKDRVFFSIITNGILLDKFYNKLFKYNAINKLYISIDHHDPYLNAKSRGIPRLEQKLYPIIQKIKKDFPNVKIIINHVLSKNNIDTFIKFINKMKELNIDAVNLIPIKGAVDLNVTIEQIDNFEKTLADLFSNEVIAKDFFLNGISHIYGPKNEWEKASQGTYTMKHKKACIIPAAVLFIDGPTGEVYPCDTTIWRENPKQYLMGNILNDSVANIWNGELFNTFRKKMYPNITCECINGCDPTNIIE